MVAIFSALFGFALMVGYWPGISGAATSPRWVVITIGTLGLIFTGPVRWTWAHVIGGLFVAWAIGSIAWSVSPLDSVDAAWKLLALGGLFVIGSALADLRPVYAGAAVGLAVSSALVILDRLDLIAYPQTAAPSGLFVNGLFLAEAAAMVMVACVALRWWWLVGLLAPALVLVTVPRGPIVALAVVAIVTGWGRMPVRAWLAALLAFGGGTAALVAMRPASGLARLAMWADGVGMLSWAGTGLWTYAAAAPFYALRFDVAAYRPTHPHNELLEVAITLGVPGIMLAGLLVAVLLLGGTNRPARLVLLAFLVEGCFGFPFSLPATAGLAALVAGHLARDLPDVFPVADARRVATRHSDGQYRGAGVNRRGNCGGRDIQMGF